MRTDKKEKKISIHFNNKRLLELFFVLVSIAMILEYRQTPQLKTFAINFVAIILEAFPFMLFGAMIGGFIESFISQEKLTNYFKKKGDFFPIIIGASVGLIFPVCECAIVPVVRRLLRKGTPIGAAVAYLLAGPIFNPIVAASTAVAYSYDFVVVAIRMVAGLLIAITIGILVNRFFKNKNILVNQENDHHDGGDDHCCHHHHHHHQEKQSWQQKVKSAIKHGNEEFFDVGKYLIFGAFIAALSQTFIERDGLIGWMSNPILSIIVMMAMALVLNLCSESDAFIAATFRNSPIPLAAQMAFMVLGPMLDFKLIMMYMSVFKKRLIIFLVSTIILLVFISAIALHLGGLR